MSSVDSIPSPNGVLILRCEYQSFLIIKIVLPILFNWCVSLQVDPITSTFARSIISSSQRCLFHPSPSCLCFSRPPTLFPQGLRFLYQVFLYSCEISPFLLRQCSYPVILKKILTKLQVIIIRSLSSPVDSIQVLSIISSFQIFSHAGAPLNHPLLAIRLFRSAQDVSKIRVSTLHSFKLFRGCYLIQVT